MDVSRWTINEWKVEGTGKIPADAFGERADLLILNKGSYPCPVVWVDAKAKLCWIDSMPMDGVPVQVHFGPTEVPCWVTFTFTPGGKLMSGTLREVTTKDGGDGNAGTFAAEGSGPPLPDPTGE